eukprot:scaffold38150_cov65-Phaeocystis_antarctica.AAC.12
MSHDHSQPTPQERRSLASTAAEKVTAAATARVTAMVAARAAERREAAMAAATAAAGSAKERCSEAPGPGDGPPAAVGLHGVPPRARLRDHCAVRRDPGARMRGRNGVGPSRQAARRGARAVYGERDARLLGDGPGVLAVLEHEELVGHAASDGHGDAVPAPNEEVVAVGPRLAVRCVGSVGTDARLVVHRPQRDGVRAVFGTHLQVAAVR